MLNVLLTKKLQYNGERNLSDLYHIAFTANNDNCTVRIIKGTVYLFHLMKICNIIRVVLYDYETVSYMKETSRRRITVTSSVNEKSKDQLGNRVVTGEALLPSLSTAGFWTVYLKTT